MVRKVHLSSNLETLIANLLEKKNPAELENQIAAVKEAPEHIQTAMKRWFPDINNHALWTDQEKFKKIIVKGCWPLHPCLHGFYISYLLSENYFNNVQLFLFIADVFDGYKNIDCLPGKLILPVELCNEDMIAEFLVSEEYGRQGATAHAYESVIQKYQHELSTEQSALLKAVLLSSKIGFKVDSKEECLQVFSLFSGVDMAQ